VTENGVADDAAPVAGVVDDSGRIELLRGFLAGLHAAIAEGADVRAYYVWSLLDNYEWAFGTSKRFGIVWTDFATQARLPKASARFYAELVRRNGLDA
jgi:beta-glucosidase